MHSCETQPVLSIRSDQFVDGKKSDLKRIYNLTIIFRYRFKRNQPRRSSERPNLPY